MGFLLKAWPFILTIVVGTAIGFTSYTKGLQKGYERSIKEFTDSYKPQKCPDCNCPPQQAALDIDKLKGFKNFRGTISVPVTQQMIIDGDSAAMESFRMVLIEEMEKLKLSRCK